MEHGIGHAGVCNVAGWLFYGHNRLMFLRQRSTAEAKSTTHEKATLLQISISPVMMPYSRLCKDSQICRTSWQCAGLHIELQTQYVVSGSLQEILPAMGVRFVHFSACNLKVVDRG